MIELGRYNRLRITRFTDHGAYLDGGEVGEILMPKAFVESTMRAGDEVEVFVYLDQSERLVGTRERPLAQVGDFAALQVAWVNEFGAFLSWGVQKDLFVPFREQKKSMEMGRTYIVYIYVDDATHRIVGTAKIDKFLKKANPHTHHRGQAVDLLVWQKTPLGFKVIVDNAYAGMLYDSQIIDVPHTGDRLDGSVVSVRDDGRLDIALGSIGKQRFRDFAADLEEALKEAGGSLPYGDATPADEIQSHFGVSKKTFKRAVGTLYKARRIELTPEGIKLTDSAKQKTHAAKQKTPSAKQK